MVLYILGLGGALFSMLGAGVIMVESGGETPGITVPSDVTDLTSLSASASPFPTPTSEATPSPPPASPSPSMSTSPTQAPPAKDKITTMEDEVTSLINQERAKAGCAAVRTDERIRTASRAHSADMAKQNYFSHTGKDGSSFVDRMARAGYPRNSAGGENIAMGYGSAAAVVKGWMNSEGHKRNILNCSFKAVGNGLAYRGNTPYWTQDFGRS